MFLPNRLYLFILSCYKECKIKRPKTKNSNNTLYKIELLKTNITDSGLYKIKRLMVVEYTAWKMSGWCLTKPLTLSYRDILNFLCCFCLHCLCHQIQTTTIKIYCPTHSPQSNCLSFCSVTLPILCA